METLLVGSALLSLFHAIIPSHWLPVLAVGRQQGWPPSRVLWVTFLAGSAHVLSTVLAGVLFALAGQSLASYTESYTHWLAPAILIIWGVFYVYQHYRHRHFHLQGSWSRWGVVGSLAIAMFFSPCLEIEGYFLAGGHYGWWFVLVLALTYAVISIAGMLAWVSIALRGLQKLDWHAWEHNAGLITGTVLIISGLVLLVLE